MGTCFSKKQEKQKGIKRRPSSVVSNGPRDIFLPTEDGDGDPRVIGCEESIHTTLGKLNIRYGYISQRGYYPDDENKPNQDSYSVIENFNNNPNDALFSVYDGHGRYGDKCAQFAADHLPHLIERHVEKCKLDRGRRSMTKRYSNTSVSSVRSDNTMSRMSQNNAATANLSSIELSKEMTQLACATAHKQCNVAMHSHPRIDDSLSGTTAISCYIHGRRNRITVCNVGDSRAVLGKRIHRKGSNNGTGSGNGGKNANTANSEEAYYKALPLSRDQTPYRRDERKRIRAYGGRILSLDQIEGLEPIVVSDSDDEHDENGKNDIDLGKEIDEDGDPPRVWHPKQDYPGTAFTRSLGDALAEELGVYAEPEMVTRELEDGDEIIVLASDGVFEFLTNQSVIDICAKFKDPLSACKAVVAESYELWLQYELRTDDITMICIFIDANNPVVENNNANSNHSTLPSPKSPHGDTFSDHAVNDLDEEEDDEKDDLPEMRESKPVRSRPSIEKSNLMRKMSSKAFIDSNTLDEGDFDISKLYTEKSDQEKACIAQAIKACVMLQSITDEQRDMIYKVMEPVDVTKGDWIIKQGTVGDRFYIVEEGSFEVRIVSEGQEDTKKNGGVPVHTYEGSLENHMHPSFGELALLYSVPRAASIVAMSDGKLWALHKSALRKVLVEQSGRKELLVSLRKIQVLKNFKEEELEYIAGTMKLETFGKNHTITKNGSVGKSFYIISKGQCEISGKKGKKRIVLSNGQCFGEEIIKTDNDRYTATIKTTAKTSCWKLEVTVIEALKKQFSSSK